MRAGRALPSGTVGRARTLRRNATEAEKRLWRALRDAFPQLKWRRQVPVGPYFADLLCFPERLVIEVDGGQHDDATDAARTRYLDEEGYRVQRFWNNDVLESPEGVIARISVFLREREEGSTRPSPNAAARQPAPLHTGEGL